jgi:transcriptional regulator with XRE-family HTH domain
MSSVHSARYKGLLKRLREARLQAGLTQGEAARAVGRPQSFVSKCESGERRIDVLELVDFARVYGTSLGFLAAEAESAKGSIIAAERKETYESRRRRRRTRT